MKHIILTIVFAGLCLVAGAQEKAKELYIAGNAQYKAGKYIEAIMIYSELIELTDDSRIQKAGYINRGLARHAIQKFDLAIDDFTKAIELDSADMASYVDRGLSRMGAAYMADAKADFNYVVEKANDQQMIENALYWLIRIHYASGEFQEAINKCDAFISHNNKDAEVYFLRALSYEPLMKIEKAIADYDKAIELKPDYMEAYANRGTMKINLLTTNGNISPSKKETADACADLKKAKQLGDTAVDDMLYIYCK